MMLPITTGEYYSIPTVANNKKKEYDNPFSQMLSSAVENVEKLQKVKDEDAYALSIGEIDDPATLAINSLKYDTALAMLVQMRDRLMNSYNEIMRMNM